MNVYRMSESGSCPKALAAARLRYNSVTQENSVLLREGKRHEIHVAEDLASEGFYMEDAGECLQCREEFGETGISGHHVEIVNPLVRLIGHIDRYLIIDDVRYPVEIKSMGLFAFKRFLKEGLGQGYESQIACYTGQTEKPALYVVKNRDSGEMLKFTVPFGDTVIPGLKILPIHTTLEQVLDKLHLVEAYVRTEELPDCDLSDKWCNYKYLCAGTGSKDLPEATEQEVLIAAREWKENREAIQQLEVSMSAAREILLSYARKVSKFSAEGVSVSYQGMRSRTTWDEKVLKELLSEEQISAARKQGKPYEDLRIRILGNDSLD